jgi:NAD(P)-dependent dehydrogenase (short-subunit alcohol dehydrogenase family)
MDDPKSRLSVVIGGANGIGAARRRPMSKRGWRVAVIDVDSTAARSVATEIGGYAYAADITDQGAREQIAAEIEREHGPVCSLVVSSGAFRERFAPADFPMTCSG